MENKYRILEKDGKFYPQTLYGLQYYNTKWVNIIKYVASFGTASYLDGALKSKEECECVILEYDIYINSTETIHEFNPNRGVPNSIAENNKIIDMLFDNEGDACSHNSRVGIIQLIQRGIKDGRLNKEKIIRAALDA